MVVGYEVIYHFCCQAEVKVYVIVLLLWVGEPIASLGHRGVDCAVGRAIEGPLIKHAKTPYQ